MLCTVGQYCGGCPALWCGLGSVHDNEHYVPRLCCHCFHVDSIHVQCGFMWMLTEIASELVGHHECFSLTAYSVRGILNTGHG